MDLETTILVEQGKEAFSRGDYRVAEQCFTKVVQRHAEWPEMHGKLGTIYHQQGKFTDAIKLYAHAIALNPQYLEARLNLAVLLNDMGQYEQASRLLANLKKNVPYPGRLNMVHLAERHMVTGDAYFAIQLYEHSRVEYEHAAKLRPGWPDLKRKLAATYRRLGRYKDALHELEAAMAINGKDPDLQTEFALCHYQSGNRQQASLLWQAVLEKHPDHEMARRFQTMMNNGRHHEIAAA